MPKKKQAHETIRITYGVTFTDPELGDQSLRACFIRACYGTFHGSWANVRRISREWLDRVSFSRREFDRYVTNVGHWPTCEVEALDDVERLACIMFDISEDLRNWGEAIIYY